jgi:hypothetical protein
LYLEDVREQSLKKLDKLCPTKIGRGRGRGCRQRQRQRLQAEHSNSILRALQLKTTDAYKHKHAHLDTPRTPIEDAHATLHNVRALLESDLKTHTHKLLLLDRPVKIT